MKLPIIIACAALVAVVIGQAVSRSLHLSNPGMKTDSLPTSHHLHPRAVEIQVEWDKAWCKGSKLSMAMIKPESQASHFLTPIRSSWDGDLTTAFQTWGYRELPNHCDGLCDFSSDQHHLARAFQDLGIDTRSAGNGGPNTCHHIEHQYGPTVERDSSGQWPPPDNQWYTARGRRLRETQAYTMLGTNTLSGALYFFNRLSPREAAHINWDVPVSQIQTRFLPNLSASSDHAWGFWNRAHPGGVGIADINKIFMCMITNDVTIALIAEALRTYPLPPGVTEAQRPKEVEKWPGTTFEMHYDAACVLGSPNGQAAGYFLAQHKHRFGKSKTVEKVTVFRADTGMMPYLLFWVIDAPAGPVASDGKVHGGSDVGTDGQGVNSSETKAHGMTHVVEERIVTPSGVNTSDVREYVFRAKL